MTDCDRHCKVNFCPACQHCHLFVREAIAPGLIMLLLDTGRSGASVSAFTEAASAHSCENQI